MGDLWRSQEMQLLSLIIQNDTAHDVISKMGELGLVDFRDVSLHPAPRAAPSSQTAPFAPLHPAKPSGAPKKLRKLLPQLCPRRPLTAPSPPPAAQRAAAVAHAHLRRRRAQVRRDEPAAPPHQGRARRGGRRARPHQAGGGRALGGAGGEGRRDERGDHGAPRDAGPAPPEPQRAGGAEARARARREALLRAARPRVPLREVGEGAADAGADDALRVWGVVGDVVDARRADGDGDAREPAGAREDRLPRHPRQRPLPVHDGGAAAPHRRGQGRDRRGARRAPLLSSPPCPSPILRLTPSSPPSRSRRTSS